MMNQFISVTGCPREKAEKILSSYKWQFQTALSHFMDRDLPFDEDFSYESQNHLSDVDHENKGRLKRFGDENNDDQPKSKKIKVENLAIQESIAPSNTPATPPDFPDALSMLSQMSTEDFDASPQSTEDFDVSPQKILLSPKLASWYPAENQFSLNEIESSWFESDPPNSDDSDISSPSKDLSGENTSQFDLELEHEKAAI